MINRWMRISWFSLAIIAIVLGGAPFGRAAPQPSPVAASPESAFVFERVTSDFSRSDPSVCLNFSQKLLAKPDASYRTWITLAPKADVHLQVQDKALCFEGLQFGKDYTVTMAAGLPAQGGGKLAQDATATVSLGDRKKMVGFSDPGFILSRDAKAGLGIDTVNVDRVAVDVLRINDRLAPAELKRLRDNPPDYAYALKLLAGEKARLVWSGVLDIKNSHNELIHTAFPLSKLSIPREAGLYLVVVANNADLKPREKPTSQIVERLSLYDEYGLSSRLVIQTDLAITGVTAADGLHVFVRSFATAEPVGGVDLALEALDRQILGKLKTDGTGHAVFAPGLLRGTGPAAPTIVVATGKEQDFSLLDLTQAAFDLSDRGVTGRSVPGPIDAFVYTDRGIYRPGETIHLGALLRDRLGQAVENVPLTLVMRKPGGLVLKRTVATAEAVGLFHQDFDLPDTASRGMWHLEATDADGKSIGSVGVEVQDFVPQRLKVAVRSDQTTLHAGDPITIALDGRFLYGAPASSLGVEGHATVDLDPAPFPQSADGYQFGAAGGTFEAKEIPLTGDMSDANGHAHLTGTLDIPILAPVPLRAVITAGLQEPGGRVTSDSVIVPIRTPGLSLGIRPKFKNGAIQEDSDAGFEVIALDEEGKQQATAVNWTLIETTSHYDWVLRGSRWTYHRSDTDRIMASGTLKTRADQPVSVSQRVGWGNFRFVAEIAGKTLSSVGFRAGWTGTEPDQDRPDKVEVTAEQARYPVGGTAKVRIMPPHAGKVRLLVARDKVFETREIDVPREGKTVEIPVSADWGAGAYVLASLYRPADGGKGHLPVRAIGLVWIGVDPGAQVLTVDLKAPDKITPRQTLDLPVHVAGARPGEPVSLTVAAVDEGILQLTRFQSPDPVPYYFGQRSLAIDIRDDYGRLLDGNEGPVGTIRSGGDAGFGGKGLPVVPTKSVALYSGPVSVGPDGNARVPLAIPDFEGELRLMVVAAGRSGVGHAEGHVTVRDPVVPDLALPRFLAPDDEARMTMLVDNRDGVAGDYVVAFSVTGPARLPDDKPWRFSLKAGERKVAGFPIVGIDEGVASVTATLEGPNGLAITRTWSIAVRGAHAPITLATTVPQRKGEAFTLDQHLLDAFLPGSVTAKVGYSRLGGLDVAGLLTSLWLYPYGCTEQLTSTAYPLVYFDDPALGGKAVDKAGVKKRVQGAIDRIIDRQDIDGTFGLWRSGDRLGGDWLGLYVLDFLIHAKAAGYDVPDTVLERSYGHAVFIIRRNAMGTGRSADLGAYAAWLLAPAHRADLGYLRMLHDGLKTDATKVAWSGGNNAEASPLAVAQLAGALAILGDKARASNAMRMAVTMVDRPFIASWWENGAYWSRVRDAAGILAVAAESDQLALVQSLVPKLQSFSKTPDLLSTQEKAWLLSAAHGVTAGDKMLGLIVNGRPFEAERGRAALTPTAGEIAAGFTVVPTGQDLWRTVLVQGVPKGAVKAIAKGVTLNKTYRATDGSPLDVTKLRQNQRFIVTLEGSVADDSTHRMMLVDLLPAGWEIEAVIRPDTAPEFLAGVTRLRMVEARDDRYLAAIDLGSDAYSRDRSGDDADEEATADQTPVGEKAKKDPDKEARQGRFRAAYLVRAVTPGRFTLPEAGIDDMYRPGVVARTASGTVEVVEP